jgi:hypothetical protein
MIMAYFPGHDAIMDRTQYCAQIVRWNRDNGPYCWAHGKHTISPQADCMSSNHGCNEPGTGRLGLCPKHELEVLGD